MHQSPGNDIRAIKWGHKTGWAMKINGRLEIYWRSQLTKLILWSSMRNVFFSDSGFDTQCCRLSVAKKENADVEGHRKNLSQQQSSTGNNQSIQL